MKKQMKAALLCGMLGCLCYGLRYVAPEDIHVYSIDEVFIDATPYLHLYQAEAEKQGVSPAHCMAMIMIRDVLKTTGITATVGIGTNLYLAKIGMDIVAKKQQADKDGVRIAELDESLYKLLLWTHRPLTDFWQIGPGTAHRLASRGMNTMGDIAAMSQSNEDMLYKMFGINAEILNRRLTVLHNLTCNTRMAKANRVIVTVKYYVPCTDEHSFACGIRGQYMTEIGVV